MEPWPPAFSVEGEHVAVVPLDRTHEDALKIAAADGELHRLWYTLVPSPEGMRAEIERRLALRETGSMQPFTIMSKTTGEPVGMTTYMNIDAPNRRVEIGSTWYRKSVQRSPLNTECKLLLLRHAFETLDCIAVEFRTHFLNQQSRRAIERLGAKLDGILRSHQISPNGTTRDTAVYSIIASEWPAIEANLMWQLDKPRD
ncbi:GNAT family N-acetyltransferase [Qingshengfaniella alkalisoli]|uniref:GNAT family N-acetyltransferase n=1 Tax=Qingshengfaniella alkalisoli TaxID=2599296 RepID=A0A5B8IR79_9RHOB|nr:GNAT family protein [Qingshengfaniella alkalisoli]QDY68692.1 GNAT family N-acetyltransferase [Qingshengfaniella alkalisoli]